MNLQGIPKPLFSVKRLHHIVLLIYSFFLDAIRLIVGRVDGHDSAFFTSSCLRNDFRVARIILLVLDILALIELWLFFKRAIGIREFLLGELGVINL